MDGEGSDEPSHIFSEYRLQLPPFERRDIHFQYVRNDPPVFETDRGCYAFREQFCSDRIEEPEGHSDAIASLPSLLGSSPQYTIPSRPKPS